MAKPTLVTIQRTNPLGETVAIEVELDSREDFAAQWNAKVIPAFKAADWRLEHMNQRILAVSEKTMQLNAREASVIRNILAMATGFMPPTVLDVKEKVEEGGNLGSRQWIDNVTPDEEGGEA